MRTRFRSYRTWSHISIRIMRLWSLHPAYLDTRGLAALWREALLAQAVLKGRTKGYTHHPQLTRFRASPSPLEAIAAYLRAVHAEASRRGYQFDEKKIVPGQQPVSIPVTQGQLDYEWRHLKEKLQRRAPAWLAGLPSASFVQPHPLFYVVGGPVEPWEILQQPKTLTGNRGAVHDFALAHPWHVTLSDH
jgi:hypothetical protein